MPERFEVDRVLASRDLRRGTGSPGAAVPAGLARRRFCARGGFALAGTNLAGLELTAQSGMRPADAASIELHRSRRAKFNRCEIQGRIE
jgi:hypothetical protein